MLVFMNLLFRFDFINESLISCQKHVKMSSSIEEDVMRIKKRLEKMMKSNEVDVQVRF